jgi:hypothetical protein
MSRTLKTKVAFMHKEPCLCTNCNFIPLLFLDSCVEACDDEVNDVVDDENDHVADDEVDDEVDEIATVAPKRKRPARSPTTKAKHGLKKRPNKKTKMAYTIDSIKKIWPEGMDYGDSFRAMGPEEQIAEVDRLNTGLDKGMKGVIKTKLLSDNYQKIIAEKLKSHLSQCRSSLPAMFHAAATTRNAIVHDVNFISVGEWVEVDADRSVGYNSEGGIAVIIKVEDDLADVK